VSAYASRGSAIGSNSFRVPAFSLQKSDPSIIMRMSPSTQSSRGPDCIKHAHLSPRKTVASINGAAVLRDRDHCGSGKRGLGMNLTRWQTLGWRMHSLRSPVEFTHNQARCVWDSYGREACSSPLPVALLYLNKQ